MADFVSRRTTMVDTQVRPSDVTKYPIIDAMLRVPREDFVPDSAREIAYVETNIDLGNGRQLLAARSFAKMLEAANIGKDELVLDLGCGLGYSAAVLAHMAQAVVAVEPDAEMAEEAQRILSEHDIDNAAIVAGNPPEGSAGSAPYDVIVVEGAIETWPQALTDQLRDGGRAVALWAGQGGCTARIGVRHDGRMTWRDVFVAPAAALAGFEAVREFAL